MATAQEYYNQALQALKSNDRNEAIRLLAESVGEDDSYLDSWIKLAEIMPDSDDKYDVLENILRLDPDNKFAKVEWDRMNLVFAQADDAAANTGNIIGDDGSPPKPTQKPKAPVVEVVPGIAQSELRLAIIGLAAYTIIMLVASFSIRGALSSQENREARQATQYAVGLTRTVESFASVREETQVAVLQGTETAVAMITPSATATRPRGANSAFADAPTEIPPSPTPTEIAFRIQPIPPETVGITGRILAYGGANPAEPDFLPLRVYSATDGQAATRNVVEYANVFVSDATSDVLLQTIVGEVFDLRNRIGVLQVMTGADPTTQSDITALVNSLTLTDGQNPVMSLTGNEMVFSAVNLENNSREIYLYTFQSEAITQLTNNPSVDYIAAAIAPNAREVIAVADQPQGRDLVFINLASGTAPDSTECYHK